MRWKAFTLIELLVVISIIAVLMAILMPSLRLAKDQAQRIHCTSNVKTLALGWLMYKDEFDGKIVGGNTGGRSDWVNDSGATTWEDQKEGIREGKLFKYVGEEVDIYRCPADRRRPTAAGVNTAFRTFSIPGGANGQSWGSCKNVTLYTDLKNPATKYIFVEEMDTRAGGNLGSWQFERGRWVDPLAMWHNNKSTLGFADGHVEMRDWRDRKLIEWNLTAVNNPNGFVFSCTPEEDDRKDFDYMVEGYPCKSF